MKKQKIAIYSIIAVLVIFVSIISFQASSEERYFESESKSLNLEKEEIISKFQESENLLKLTGDGVVTFDTEDYLLGHQSLKLATKGGATLEKIRLTNLDPPIDFSGKFLKAWLKIDHKYAINRLGISVSSDNFETSKIYWIHQRLSSPTAKSFQNNVWSLVTISLTQTTGTTDLSKINSIEIFLKDNGNQPVTTWFNSLSLVENNKKLLSLLHLMTLLAHNLQMRFLFYLNITFQQLLISQHNGWISLIDYQLNNLEKCKMIMDGIYLHIL